MGMATSAIRSVRSNSDGASRRSNKYTSRSRGRAASRRQKAGPSKLCRWARASVRVEQRPGTATGRSPDADPKRREHAVNGSTDRTCVAQPRAPVGMEAMRDSFV
eukprot:scaffold8275_cov61-Phaeocystis_antarctica.AAC.2